MRTLPTLGVYSWLVAATAFPALSALEWIVGGVAQAQQLSPPDRGGLNLLQQPPLDLFQKEPHFRGYQDLVGGLERFSPPTSDWQSSYWMSSVSDLLSSYWISRASDWRIRRSLLFSVREIGSRPVGDYWKPGEFERLIGP